MQITKKMSIHLLSNLNTRAPAIQSLPLPWSRGRCDCITESIQPPILKEKVKRKPLYKNSLNSSDDNFVMARNYATVLQREIITATGCQRSVWFIVALATYVKPCFDVAKSTGDSSSFLFADDGI